MILTVVTLSFLAGAPVLPEGADATARAREAFQAGQDLYKQGRYLEAVARFEQAYATRQHPAVFFNIAKCRQQLGETGKALRAYRDYLRLKPDAADREQVREEIASLERRLRETGVQQLLVLVEPTGARVSIDGKDLGPAPASVELPAGEHRLSVSADGFLSSERPFVTTLTRAIELNVTLVPLLASDAPRRDEGLTPPPVPPPELGLAHRKPRLFTWVAGGAAVASLGVGIGLGVASASASASLRNAEAPLDRAKAQQLSDQATGFGTGANVAYALAGAALVTAVVLFFVEGS